MFTQKKKIYYAKIMGFKSVEDFDNFSKRFLIYLQKDKLTKNRVMSGFFILEQIQKESLKNKELINFDNIKNQHIKKYADTILDLRKNGNGSQSIIQYLYENHRVKISRGTIEKFYKQNGL
ncbi:MAG: hypothetical protein U9N59_12750 [Campylobacterota bacterium]|nr:hypothetical protein [Campylobacterota bacterium]